jgi:hypothetical protein
MYPVHAPLPPDSSYETWLNSSLSAKSPICEPFFDWLEGWQLYVKQLQETFPVYVPLHIQQDPFAGVVDLSKPFDWEALSGPQMIMLDDSILLGRKEETIPSYRSRGDSEEEDLRLIDKLRTQRHELSEARTRTKQRDLRIPSNATMQPGKRNRLFVANDSDSDSGSSTKTYVTAPTGRSPTRSPESEGQSGLWQSCTQSPMHVFACLRRPIVSSAILTSPSCSGHTRRFRGLECCEEHTSTRDTKTTEDRGGTTRAI